jgi:hypothetical protein
MTHRVNKRWTLSGLAGYRRVDRYNHHEENYVSNTITGRAKIRYRRGLRFSVWAKYQLDYTVDPFVSGRGLFEARGREALASFQIPQAFRRAFYHQREDLRYQSITTSPTMRNRIELYGQYQPHHKVGLSGRLKLQIDKNDDLDSLDIKQSLIQPSLGVNLTPDEGFSLFLGYNMQLAKSRGPITVALFDG